MLRSLSLKHPAATFRPARRATLLSAVLIAVLAGSRAADAQIDTPAASEARASLRAVEVAYGNRLEWNQWSRILNLPDVGYELRAGDRAEPAPLRAAILQLLGGQVRQFAEPPFARLAKALDVRAQEITVIPASDWPSACRSQAEGYAPIAPEAVEQARVEFGRLLDGFEKLLPSVRLPNDTWGTFLYWPETRALATPSKPAPAADAQLLDRLETHWAAAPAVWDSDLLFETSLAARSYIRLLRGYLKGETRERHAAAWNELAELISQTGPDSRDASKIAAALVARESLGQASRLTASIRCGLSRPNLIVQVRKKWLESQFSQKFDEPYEVNGVFAGTQSFGSGRMVGTMRSEILPSGAVGQWLLRIKGTSTARTSGSQEGVSVVSRATTRVSGTKPFLLDSRGLTPQRASAGAITAIVYESINAPGRARRREAAISETYARRPQAESESASYARRSALERINAAAADLAADFNRSYFAQMRDPRIKANRPGPEVRVRSSSEELRWECLLEGPTTFAAPTPPPEFKAGTEVVMCLAESALEEQGVMTLGGRHMTGEELQKTIGPALGESGKPGGDDFSVTFDKDPCDIRFDDGAIHARLYITTFDSADVKYPAMTVDVAYRPLEREGKVVFVRQGRLRVTPIVSSEGNAPLISGRQQTLRLAVERKLAKVLSAELLFSGAALPLSRDEKTTLRLERAQVVAPWLQIGLAPESKS
ncbi:MAG: hypothetical protein WD063_18440 [Pirellulales bacterium]